MLFGPKAMSRNTVSSKSWYSGYWNTSPTWNRTARSSALSAWMSAPPKSTWPPVGFRRPFRCWMKVLLPLPVWPMTPSSSPSSMESDISSIATFSNGVPWL